ncbi:hypothetical protein BSKO_05950 [Bryopsis sp. KO-2023]|nr:hypothetical protein BSKO_05950 [Bryopsis sp. KO-2023]
MPLLAKSHAVRCFHAVGLLAHAPKQRDRAMTSPPPKRRHVTKSSETPHETNEGLYRYEIPVNRDESLVVLSDPAHLYGYCIGNQLWTSGQEVVRYFARFPDALFRRKRILELGAGLGVPGQAFLLRGAKVVFTDQPQMLPLLKRNIEENFGKKILREKRGGTSRASIRVLMWDRPFPTDPIFRKGSFDFVLGCDICYDPKHYLPLIRTFSACKKAMVVFAFPPREETIDFLHACSSQGFCWRTLSVMEGDHLINPVHIVQIFKHKILKKMKRVLFVWDFDWSLVDANSDPWVIDKVGASDIFARLRGECPGWTELMDQTFLHAHQEKGVTESDIRKASHTVPLHPGIAKGLKELGCLENVEMVIVSDANSVFIEEILTFHDLKSCFKEIFTNPGSFENGALRVGPHHTESHFCENCPSNLCKGQIMEGLLLGQKYDSVIYVGDGGGDYCPSTKLGPSDFVLARTSYPGKKKMTPLLQKLTTDGFPIQTASDRPFSPSNGESVNSRAAGGSGTEDSENNHFDQSCPSVVTWEDPEQLAGVLNHLHGTWAGKKTT